jgi:hypothetical protein
MWSGAGLVLVLVLFCGYVIIVSKSMRRGMTMMAHGHPNRNAEKKRQERKVHTRSREWCCD